MTSSRNRDSVGKKLTGEPVASVSPKRRRLIKGLAAAAPGIFTLYSGNAQAMLSTWQCTAHSRDVFSGEQELAGEAHEVDGFVRLAEGPGIHVVWTDQETSDEIEDEIEEDEIENEIENEIEDLNEIKEHEIKEKWLIMVMDSAGVAHYIEAGFLAGDTGNTTSGTSWNDSLAGVEWLPAEDSGAGVVGSPLKLIDPSSDPSDPNIYIQVFNEVRTIQVLACIDDSGNIVSAYPQDCQALGLAPPSGSCWASLGTESINTWWG
jgi:hypothetical protein